MRMGGSGQGSEVVVEKKLLIAKHHSQNLLVRFGDTHIIVGLLPVVLLAVVSFFELFIFKAGQKDELLIFVLL